MAMTGPIEYLRQVRSEIRKISWPSRQETTVSTIAVFVMVFFASLFLYFADQIIAFLVRFSYESAFNQAFRLRTACQPAPKNQFYLQICLSPPALGATVMKILS